MLSELTHGLIWLLVTPFLLFCLPMWATLDYFYNESYAKDTLQAHIDNGEEFYDYLRDTYSKWSKDDV